MKSLTLALAGLLAPVLALAVWQWPRRKMAEPVPVPYLVAIEGAKLLREWCTWLATISSTALGAAAFTRNGLPVPTGFPELATVAMVAFGLSVLCTATLLLALPSVVTRLDTGVATASNDLYQMPAFL